MEVWLPATEKIILGLPTDQPTDWVIGMYTSNNSKDLVIWTLTSGVWQTYLKEGGYESEEKLLLYAKKMLLYQKSAIRPNGAKLNSSYK